MDAIVAEAQRRVEPALKAALRKAMTRIAAALSERDTWSVAEMETLVSVVRGALEDAGVYELSERFGIVAKAITKAAADVAPLSAAEGNLLAAAVKARYEGWEATVDRQIIDWIRDRMISQSVEPLDYMTLADEISQHLDETVVQYAGTYAETAISQIERDAWIATGEALGAEYWRWDGPPPIDTSHPECEEYWNHVFTREELEAMGENSTGLPVWPTLGGWGCRHTPTPVDPETAVAERGEK